VKQSREIQDGASVRSREEEDYSREGGGGEDTTQEDDGREGIEELDERSEDDKAEEAQGCGGGEEHVSEMNSKYMVGVKSVYD
jgi:hypothetical protein